MKKGLLLAAVIAAVIVAAGCGKEKSAPEQAFAGYIDAVREHRCDAAKNFLSTRTRYALDWVTEQTGRVDEDRRAAGRPHGLPAAPIEHYYCYDLMFEHCKAGEMTLATEQGDTARVSMPCGRTQDSILPGFTSMFLKYQPRITDLVREEDEWRVVLPTLIRIVEVREQEDAAREAYERRRQGRQ